MGKDTEIAVYYFPNYHRDPFNEDLHGEGWNEWELLKRATPRFLGHQQPKVPAWGYEDESDPVAMARKIDAAADHGIDTFLFDWYWYSKGPFLHRALEEGFLKADNRDRLKFSLMWANHDWIDIMPCPKWAAFPREGDDVPAKKRFRPVQEEGFLAPEKFTEATTYMIEHYFGQPNYWRVNGGLYFSIYDLMNLVQGFGGIEETRAGLDDFRERVRQAGHGELHLNAIVVDLPILPGGGKVENINAFLKQLGFDSVSTYTWFHHYQPESFPTVAYEDVRAAAERDFRVFTERYDVSYYPHVSMGWDPSPRTVQSDAYAHAGYPYTPIWEGNTPEAFEQGLNAVKRFLDEGWTQPRIFTINAWNEWTEGSYLEPDLVHGMKYLEAIRNVFGKKGG
ncbi:glycoside hydrolase family 99-like domain-containing protein [Paenibacillus montanisoli]|uniref:Glycosyl transferase n=1 Tax=Paenibacillus montanisoli TaxID=2081970 RepID=A0A328U6D0_9BACL|nr:glycoside hydrolase family 99-like domain-containing protein [Paenibacillus montanisoli]RAP76961.1 hypothetical protein DL346_00160 [Paenibacillus montanisoli]